MHTEGVHDDITVSRSAVRCVNEHDEWCCQHCYQMRCRYEAFGTARPPCAICRGRLYLDATELEVEEEEGVSNEYYIEVDEEEEERRAQEHAESMRRREWEEQLQRLAREHAESMRRGWERFQRQAGRDSAGRACAAADNRV
jgi:hypothetical protein